MKHLINVKTETEVTPEDFLYEIIQAYEEKGWDVNDKSSTIPQLKWAGLSLPIHELTLEDSLKKIEELGWLKSEAKNGTQHHTIINHPW